MVEKKISKAFAIAKVQVINAYKLSVQRRMTNTKVSSTHKCSEFLALSIWQHYVFSSCS